MSRHWNVGILLFNEVEVLDFAGPFEVFSVAEIPGQAAKPFRIQTVSQTGQPITARNGLIVHPHCSFTSAAAFDILIVPGGYGAEEIEINNCLLLSWLQAQRPKVQILASVCTGVFLLAKAGLLDGKSVTTHWMDISRLEDSFPSVHVMRNVKYVDEGSLITSGGISAGITMSLKIVERLLGKEIAGLTARRMEYDINL